MYRVKKSQIVSLRISSISLNKSCRNEYCCLPLKAQVLDDEAAAYMLLLIDISSPRQIVITICMVSVETISPTTETDSGEKSFLDLYCYILSVSIRFLIIYNSRNFYCTLFYNTLYLLTNFNS